MASVAERRLGAVSNHISGQSDLVIVLPDGARVTKARHADVDATQLLLDGKRIVDFRIISDKTFAYDLSAISTRYESATTHVPKYKLVQINPSVPGVAATSCTIPDFWTVIYAFFTLYHEQEYVPISISTLQNAPEISNYLITTGLGRLYPSKRLNHQDLPDVDREHYLDRSAFWQGGGIAGYHDRFWIPNPRPVYPQVMGFTRKENVIAKHPVRPPKPQPGEVLYRRWCSAVGQMLELTYFDIDGVSDPPQESQGGVSRHMAAFHRWHNDERVNSAWGEKGGLETHRDYVRGVLADPHCLPCMFSWDGDLMGYVEVVFSKEDHSAPYFPFNDPPGEWDRGIHVLAGETKYLGNGRSDIWIRSLVHFIFLADSRTNRVVGEPDNRNHAILKVAHTAEFYQSLIFDFPYKRSVMVLQTRDKFFTLCRLR
ncbi:hypothetical protein FA15DRAFT_664473 [Coprinopsis marcescibilis]|uniref:Acyltransferase MbtK/IucB-like conserved domain-containing protein n=1 Tax=Coprinopsis marcescibilis TaxID=230819 RepID=A0A5C3L8Q9_COPMA|nr:hypothetical protein FA15DRAFT_664473 [Coprinopsis marcescibilis]